MRVVDGDSLEAEISGFGRLQIRLAYVDAPEYDQPWGREAREALNGLVRGTKPQFRLLYRDQYARVVALVAAKGAVLVQEGHAWAYEQYVPGRLRAKYKGLERATQGSRAGLWGAKAKPVSPWEWRRRETTGGWLAWLVRLVRSLLRA